MVRADVIYLITEEADTHGVHAQVERTERMVYCTIRSVGRTEYYNALNAGIEPEYVFRLAVAEEYRGERRVRYRDKLYEVVRTYMTEEDGIEITVRRSDER